jgi:ketosteroid isomerase-like protein
VLVLGPSFLAACGAVEQKTEAPSPTVTAPPGAGTPANATIDEADIRDRINKLVEAIRAMDLDGVMSIYAPDIVSFDVEPPLQHVGAEAKRTNWDSVFAAYERPLGYEIRDLAITAGDDVAFAHSLNRISGALKNGTRTDLWLRSTTCFRKINGSWLITHDQISVPFDPRAGRAFVNLAP